jgi:hypothetical protein
METNFETLESIPTELMTEIKSDEIKMDDITSGTGTALSDNFGPVQSGTNNQSGTGSINGPFPNNPNAQNIKAGSLITPDIAVAFMDVVIPVVFVLLFKKIHNQTISKKSIQLSTSEKETIKPVLQNYLNSVNFSVDSPLNALLLTLGFIYGMKYIEISNQIPNGNFNSANPPANIGEPTATGIIKKDGRGRPKGTFRKPKQVI